jgi:predicted acetyltransferase
VHFGLATPDEPLTHLLADPRAAALPVTLTLSVTDANRPVNHGLWRLAVDDHGVAHVARATGWTDLSLDVADLAVAHLGGTSFAELAAAGRVLAVNPEVVVAVDLAFGHEPAPCCTTVV